jgi:hypothetical protein
MLHRLYCDQETRDIELNLLKSGVFRENYRHTWKKTRSLHSEILRISWLPPVHLLPLSRLFPTCFGLNPIA